MVRMTANALEEISFSLRRQPHIREAVPMELHWSPRQERVPETPFHMEGVLGKPASNYDVFRSGGLKTVNCGTRLNTHQTLAHAIPMQRKNDESRLPIQAHAVSYPYLG